MVSPTHPPYLFACLHVLVACVYAFSSYIHHRPVLMHTLVLQTRKLKNVIYVWIHWNSTETWLISKQLVIVIHMLKINNEMPNSNIKFSTIKHNLLVSCVLFYSSFVCIYAYANVYFKTTIIKQNIKIRLLAGVPSSQALLGLLITAPPSVCVSAVPWLLALAVWIQNPKKKKYTLHINNEMSKYEIIILWWFVFCSISRLFVRLRVRISTSKQHSCVRGPWRECRSIRSGASGLPYTAHHLYASLM